jgi:hypothetical protein
MRWASEVGEIEEERGFEVKEGKFRRETCMQNVVAYSKIHSPKKA